MENVNSKKISQNLIQKILKISLALTFAIIFLTGTARADFTEDFEIYDNGDIIGQGGGWEELGGSGNCEVIDTESHEGNKSLLGNAGSECILKFNTSNSGSISSFLKADSTNTVGTLEGRESGEFLIFDVKFDEGSIYYENNEGPNIILIPEFTIKWYKITIEWKEGGLIRYSVDDIILTDWVESRDITANINEISFNTFYIDDISFLAGEAEGNLTSLFDISGSLGASIGENVGNFIFSLGTPLACLLGFVLAFWIIDFILFDLVPKLSKQEKKESTLAFTIKTKEYAEKTRKEYDELTNIIKKSK